MILCSRGDLLWRWCPGSLLVAAGDLSMGICNWGASSCCGLKSAYSCIGEPSKQRDWCRVAFVKENSMCHLCINRLR